MYCVRATSVLQQQQYHQVYINGYVGFYQGPQAARKQSITMATPSPYTVTYGYLKRAVFTKGRDGLLGVGEQQLMLAQTQHRRLRALCRRPLQEIKL